MKNESPLGRSCSTRVFFPEFSQVIDHLLLNAKTIVACNEEHPQTIFGYMIFDPDVVHYVFVKAAFRRFEIARDLIAHAFPGAKSLQYSQNTNAARAISAKYPELIFNPFVLYKREVSVA